MANGLKVGDTQALFFYQFCPQYVQLMNMYSIGRLATLLVKNVKNAIFGEQQLVTNFSSVFVILKLDHATIDR